MNDERCETKQDEFLGGPVTSPKSRVLSHALLVGQLRCRVLRLVRT